MLTRMATLTRAVLLALAHGALAQGIPQDTLAAVKARGQLACGVATAGIGLSISDSRASGDHPRYGGHGLRPTRPRRAVMVSRFSSQSGSGSASGSAYS